jgi:hypothetical protein
MRARWFKLGWSGAIFSGLVLLASCGDDDGDKKAHTDAGEGGEPGTAGSGGNGQGGRGGATAGNGGSAGMPLVPVACGSELCMGIAIPRTAGVQACCADEATSQCGIETSVLATFGAVPTRACEPRNQPGELDAACPESPAIEAGGFALAPFAGCCRKETGTCGYQVDSLLGGAIAIGLGCIDSAPFLGAGGGGASGEPLPCGTSAGAGGTSSGGSSGAAGSSGAGGSGTVEAGSGGTTDG